MPKPRPPGPGRAAAALKASRGGEAAADAASVSAASASAPSTPLDDDPASRATIDTFQDTMSDIRIAVYVVGRIWTATKAGQVVVRDPHSKCVAVIDETGRCGRPHCITVVDAHVWIGYAQGVMKVYSARSYKEVPQGELKRHAGAVLAIAHQGDYVYSGSADFQIMQSKKHAPFGLVRQMHGHAGGVKALVCRGEHLFSAGDDETLRVWDLATGAHLRRIHAHEGGVASLVNCGDYIWSAGEDARVQVWDRFTFKPIAALTAHAGPVVCLLPIGGEVWSGGSDAKICVWSAHPDFALLRTHDAHSGFMTCMTKVIAQPEILEVWTAGADKVIHVWGHRGTFEPDEAARLQDDLQVAQEQARRMQEQYIAALKAKDGHIETLLAKIASQAEDLLVCADIQADLNAILMQKEAELETMAGAAVERRHSGLVSELGGAKAELDGAKAALDVAAEESKAHEQRVAALQDDIAAAEQRVRGLTAELAAARTHNAELEKRVADFAEVKVELAKAEAEARRWAAEAEAHAARIAELEADAAARKRDHDRTLDELAVLRQEHAALGDAHGVAMEELKAVRATSLEQHAELIRVNGKLGECEAALREATTQLARGEARLAERDQTIADFEQVATRSGARIADRDQAIGDLEKLIDGLKEQAIARDVEIAALTSAAAQGEEVLGRRNKALSDAETRIGDLEQQVQDRNGTIERAERVGVEKDASLAALQETLVKTNELLKRTSAELSDAAAGAGREHKQQDATLADVERALARSNTLLLERDDQTRDLERKLKHLNTVIAEKDATIREAEAALAKANTLLASTSAELDASTERSTQLINGRVQTTAALEKGLRNATDGLLQKTQAIADLERELALVTARVAERDERVARAEGRTALGQKAIDTLEGKLQNLEIMWDLGRRECATLLQSLRDLAAGTLQRVDTVLTAAAQQQAQHAAAPADTTAPLLRGEIVRIAQELEHAANVLERTWREREKVHPPVVNAAAPAAAAGSPRAGVVAGASLVTREAILLHEEVRAAADAAATAARVEQDAARTRAAYEITMAGAAAAAAAQPATISPTRMRGGASPLAAVDIVGSSPPPFPAVPMTLSPAYPGMLSPTREFATPVAVPPLSPTPLCGATATPQTEADAPSAFDASYPALRLDGDAAAVASLTAEVVRLTDDLAKSVARVAELEAEQQQQQQQQQQPSTDDDTAAAIAALRSDLAARTEEGERLRGELEAAAAAAASGAPEALAEALAAAAALRNDVAALTAERDRLREGCAAAEAAGASAAEDAAREAKAAMEEELGNAQREAAASAAEVRVLKNVVERLEREKADLDAQLQKARTARSGVASADADTLAAHEATIATLQTEIADLREQLQRTAPSDGGAATADELRALVADKDAVLSQLQRDTDALHASRAAADERVGALETALRDRDAELASAKAAAEAAAAKAEALQDVIADKDAAMVRGEARLAELRDSIAQRDDAAGALCEEKDAAVARARAEADRLREGLEKAQDKIAELTNAVRSRDQDLRDKTRRVEELTDVQGEMAADCDALRQRINEQLQQIEERAVHARDAAAEHRALNERCAAQATRIDELESSAVTAATPAAMEEVGVQTESARRNREESPPPVDRRGRSISPVSPLRRSSTGSGASLERYDHITCKVDTGTGNHLRKLPPARRASAPASDVDSQHSGGRGWGDDAQQQQQQLHTRLAALTAERDQLAGEVARLKGLLEASTVDPVPQAAMPAPAAEAPVGEGAEQQQQVATDSAGPTPASSRARGHEVFAPAATEAEKEHGLTALKEENAALRAEVAAKTAEIDGLKTQLEEMEKTVGTAGTTEEKGKPATDGTPVDAAGEEEATAIAAENTRLRRRVSELEAAAAMRRLAGDADDTATEGAGTAADTNTPSAGPFLPPPHVAGGAGGRRGDVHVLPPEVMSPMTPATPAVGWGAQPAAGAKGVPAASPLAVPRALRPKGSAAASPTTSAGGGAADAAESTARVAEVTAELAEAQAEIQRLRDAAAAAAKAAASPLASPRRGSTPPLPESPGHALRRALPTLADMCGPQLASLAAELKAENEKVRLLQMEMADSEAKEDMFEARIAGLEQELRAKQQEVQAFTAQRRLVGGAAASASALKEENAALRVQIQKLSEELAATRGGGGELGRSTKRLESTDYYLLSPETDAPDPPAPPPLKIAKLGSDPPSTPRESREESRDGEADPLNLTTEEAERVADMAAVTRAAAAVVRVPPSDTTGDDDAGRDGDDAASDLAVTAEGTADPDAPAEVDNHEDPTHAAGEEEAKVEEEELPA